MLSLAVKDKTSLPQLPNHLVSAEASESSHQEILTGMRTSPLAGAAARNAGGSSSPCS